MIEVTSLRSGLVTSAYKEGAGSGSLNTYGGFTGQQDLEYVVEIDSTSGGNEVGEAEFRWRDSDSVWDESTITTTDSTYTLSNGVSISFSSATGNDFELGDKWYFRGMNLFKPGNLIDGDRNSKFRNASGDSTVIIKIDLGAAKEIKALVLYDHNIASGSTITLYGGDSTDFSTGMSTKLTWASGKIIHYLATASTWQYWAVDITSSNVGATVIEIGELFLGSYLEPTDNFEVDAHLPQEILTDPSYRPYGTRKDIYYNRRKRFNLSFPYIRSTDVDNLEAMLDSISDSTAKTYKPFFFNVGSSDLTKTYLVKCDAFEKTWHKAERYTVKFNLEEQLKSA